MATSRDTVKIFKHQEKAFYIEVSWALEQIVHRDCGIPMDFGDVQNVTGNGPEQPGLVDTALHRGLWPDGP